MRRISAIVAGLSIVALSACGSSGSGSATSESSAKQTSDSADHAAMDHDHADMGHDMAGMQDDGGLGMLKNGHHKEMTVTKLSTADQQEIDRQLQITQEVVEQYPTLGVAIDAGFMRAGPFLPGLGIHYMNTKALGAGMNPDGVIDDDDLRNPFVIIFDGTERDAPIAGFMYYSVAAEEPAGFPGTNDFWHYHQDVCNQFASDGINAPLGADRAGSPEHCAAVGGQYMAKSSWMVHVWSVPGYETTKKDGGVFAEVNPKITCADGTYHLMPAAQWPDHPMNHCRSELTSS